MDPNANLLEQEYLLTHTEARLDPEYLWELRLALREWIAKGGFEPDWAQAPNAAAFYGR